MARMLKAVAAAAIAAAGVSLGTMQDASAQGFSLSVGRGGYYGPVYGAPVYGGYYGAPVYHSYGYRGYVGPTYGYPAYGYGWRGRDWDRGDWRRLNRRIDRRFDWDD